MNLVPLQREDPGLAIVVVDNFTSADERTAVRALGDEHGWSVIAKDTNAGFGAGVNDGARWAFAHGADQMLLLNPDATISRMDLARLQKRVAADAMTMVSPTVRTPEGHVWFGGAAVDRVTGAVRSTAAVGPRDIPWLSGACLLVGRTLWERVGGFDETYFLYWEDVDLSYRVVKAGGRLQVVSEAIATHAQGGTQTTRLARAKSDAYYYHMVRNRLLFAGSHLGTRECSRWVVNAPRYAWGVVLHGGRRQLVHSLQPLGAAGRGLWDGALAARRAVAARRGLGRARLVVLQSVPLPKPTTNPYNVLLADSLRARADIDLRMFGWKEALLHRHDVFHAHWPEALITRRGASKTAVRQALFLLLLLKWQATGTTIVRTVHNLGLPSDISIVERLLLRRFDKLTTGRIILNPYTPIGRSGPVRLVPHGDYAPWFECYPRPASQQGRIAYFGMIRRYKGVEQLVRAFHETDRADLTLSVAGKASTEALEDDLSGAAEKDPRIMLTFEFLDTAALIDHIRRAELVVLPHTDMHNSGSAIAALTLGRPVLMQDNEVNRWLRTEVGDGWIHLYDGQISSRTIVGAIDEQRAHPPVSSPDLSGRDWATAGELHVQAYRESIRERGTAWAGRAGEAARGS